MNKLTRLEKSVDSTLGTVDKLVEILSSTKEDALKLVSQAEEELETAHAQYAHTKFKCAELQKRCLKTTSFIDKILNQ